MNLLSVVELGKAYRVYSSEWKRFARWFGLKPKPKDENWVLKHVSFSIHAGEAIGIIGQNGAGKSTLLKMITGTLEPSEGSVTVNGKISAILELGMGFSPELTGRQNVYHTAGMMGFKAIEVANAIAEIESFADIGDYFDKPVRVYSSGMQVRVAFSVATAFRPDILIVDEALSVGDTYFQHKSFARIKEFQEQGTTLLIVSHDRSAIQALCDRAILLESGTIIKDGSPEEVFDLYNAIIAEKENATIRIEKSIDGRAKTISGTGEARVKEIVLLNHLDQEIEFVDVGEVITLRVVTEISAHIPQLVFGYGIKDRLGQVIYGTNTFLKEQVLENVQPGDQIEFRVTFSANLGVGSYSVQTALVSSATHLENNYEWRDLALVFNVVNINKNHFVGLTWIDPLIEINRT